VVFQEDDAAPDDSDVVINQTNAMVGRIAAVQEDYVVSIQAVVTQWAHAISAFKKY
jgi:hypothetical protein